MIDEPSRRGIEGERETARIEAFSDGVFAIAISLLVFQFAVPALPKGADGPALARALSELWPSLAAFVTSFFAILIMWMNHHGVFRMVQRMNRPFVLANGLLLMVVTFVPFPTAVLATHIQGPTGKVAAAFYCATYVCVNVAYNLLWWTARSGRLLRPEVSVAHQRKIRIAYQGAFVAYTAAVGLAFWNPHAGLALSTALWVLWAILRYEERSVGATEE